MYEAYYCNLYKFKHFLAFICFFVLFILIRYINGGQRLASGKKQDLLKKSPLPTGFGSSSPVDKCMQLYLYLILCFIKKNSKLLLSYCTMFFVKLFYLARRIHQCSRFYHTHTPVPAVKIGIIIHGYKSSTFAIYPSPFESASYFFVRIRSRDSSLSL